MPLVKDPDLNRYIQNLGAKLASHAPGTKYPYTFKIVNQKDINAFALPGGPIYVNLGTIQAADNESELAGVVGHEISHVVMRHSTNQASKEEFAQLGLGLLGKMTGGSMVGQLAQMGISFGANSVFMKYSRDAEKQADLVGAGIAHDSGYNPQGMVDFFHKLETGNNARGSEFFLSHPNPGNRIQYVSKKDIVPSGNYLNLEHDLFTVTYPDNWQVLGDAHSQVTIAPRGGVSGDAVAYGAIINFQQSQQGCQPPSLDDANQQLVKQILQDNTDTRQKGSTESFKLGGLQARSTVFLGPSLPVKSGQPEPERDWMVAIHRTDGTVVYLIFIAPDQDFPQLKPAFEKMLRSLKMR